MIWIFMASSNWGRQKSNPKKAEKQSSLLDKLMKADIKDLRKFAKKHGLEAKDTSREELLDEIIQEMKNKEMI